MMRLRRTIWMAAAVVMLCFSSACGTKPEEPKENQTTQAAGVNWEDDALCVVGYIGYDRALAKEEWALAPFFLLNDQLLMPESEREYIFQTGDEVYYLLPRYDDSTVLIEEVDMNGKVSSVLYEGVQEPIVFACNMSDLYSNVRVTVTSDRDSVSFSPYISLRDGGLELPEYVQNLDVSRFFSEEMSGNDYIGNWAYVGEQDGSIYVSMLTLYGDGSADCRLGPTNSEFDFGMDGTYAIVDDSGLEDVPEGALLLRLWGGMYQRDSDGETFIDEPFSYFGIYEATVDGEGNLHLTHLRGDRLPWYWNDKDTQVFVPVMG